MIGRALPSALKNHCRRFFLHSSLNLPFNNCWASHFHKLLAPLQQNFSSCSIMKVSLITLKHKGLAYCAGFDGPAALQDTSIDKMRSQSLALKSAKTQSFIAEMLCLIVQMLLFNRPNRPDAKQGPRCSLSNRPQRVNSQVKTLGWVGEITKEREI